MASAPLTLTSYTCSEILDAWSTLAIESVAGLSLDYPLVITIPMGDCCTYELGSGGESVVLYHVTAHFLQITYCRITLPTHCLAAEIGV